MPSVEPKLSAILYCAGHFDLIRRAILHLRAQTIYDQIEVVIVCPSLAELEADESLLRDFAAYQIFEPSENRYNIARTEAILRATAPLVALREDHSFPDEQWAAATVEAHEQGYVAIGPNMLNANPKTLLSEAMFQLDYGYWTQRDLDEPVMHLPGHNSAYDKATLLKEYGDDLLYWIAVEPLIDPDLRAKGYSVTMSPNANIYHTNASRWRGAIEAQFYVTWYYNFARSEGWSLPKQVLYILATPLIPFYRLRLPLQHYNPSKDANYARSVVILVCFFLLCVSALGEMVGRIVQKPPSTEIVFKTETNRGALLSESDYRAFMSDDLSLPFGV